MHMCVDTHEGQRTTLSSKCLLVLSTLCLETVSPILLELVASESQRSAYLSLLSTEITDAALSCPQIYKSSEGLTRILEFTRQISYQLCNLSNQQLPVSP